MLVELNLLMCAKMNDSASRLTHTAAEYNPNLAAAWAHAPSLDGERSKLSLIDIIERKEHHLIRITQRSYYLFL